ncbi:MAG: DUF2970 domain-containing protein [Methylococcaceae bacterium]|jgi:hypothetical protein
MAKQNFIQVIKSVLSAFIGIQNDAARTEDFEKGSLSAYVIVGIVFTALFVLGLIFLVTSIIL